MASAISALLGLILLATTSIFAAAPTTDERSYQQTLDRLVAEHRNDLELVGLGVMVMRHGEIVASAVVGERKSGSGVALTDKDKWHIGSITKSFTATLIARMVERGTLSWNTTIGDVFGDAAEVDEAWRSVTFEQLLTHTSGASNKLKRPFSYLFREHPEGPTRTAARETLALDFMKGAPVSPPGTAFQYSNAGVLIAGVMAEKLTGITWEDLIRREIFVPLNLRSGGFGHPEDRDRALEQPRGHRSVLGFTVSVDDDPTVVIGPAGSIHLSLADLLAYANDHLQGEAGRGQLLKTETYKKLHTPALDNYAFGWVINPHAEWSNGRVIWHNGSNGMWDALLALSPNTNTIIAVVSNDGRRALTGDVTGPILEKVAALAERLP